MLATLLHVSDRARERLAWLGPLIVRVAVGWTFMMTGWGKLHGLDQVTAFFTELGIPAPGFNAHLVAVTEFSCGILLLVGALTRWAALPLIVVMAVAIWTAKRPGMESVTDLLGTEEFTYLAAFVWLALAGAGAASIDHLWQRWRGGSTPPRS